MFVAKTDVVKIDIMFCSTINAEEFNIKKYITVDVLDNWYKGN